MILGEGVTGIVDYAIYACENLTDISFPDTVISIGEHGFGYADLKFTYGRDIDEVLIGDWNGDGIDTICVCRGNHYYINNTLEGGNAEIKSNITCSSIRGLLFRLK